MNSMTSSININVKKLATIKNYQAGTNGNLLVVIQESVTPVSIIGHKSVEKQIEVLLCTATIKDKALQDELSEHVDANTRCNKVIVVSNKFMKLRNKKQLALLEIENARANVTQETNVDGIIVGEASSIEKFGKWCTYRAVNKARKVREKSTKKATKWLHRDYKKDCKEEAKLAGAAKQSQQKTEQASHNAANNPA